MRVHEDMKRFIEVTSVVCTFTNGQSFPFALTRGHSTVTDVSSLFMRLRPIMESLVTFATQLNRLCGRMHHW